MPVTGPDSLFETVPKGLRVTLKVAPKAARAEIAGIEADAAGRRLVKVRVTEAPDGGKANAAVCKLLATFFATAKSNVSIVSAASARLKQIDIAGDGATLAAVLDAWAAAAGTPGDARRGRNG